MVYIVKYFFRENDEYKGDGRGYLGHEFRGDHTDKALIEAANHHGLTEHELDTYAKSRPGRHDMDATTFLMGKTAPQGKDESDEATRSREVEAHGKIPHAKLVEHFHKAIGKVKNEKWFKEDAEEKASEAKALPPMKYAEGKNIQGGQNRGNRMLRTKDGGWVKNPKA